MTWYLIAWMATGGDVIVLKEYNVQAECELAHTRINKASDREISGENWHSKCIEWRTR